MLVKLSGLETGLINLGIKKEAECIPPLFVCQPASQPGYLFEELYQALTLT